MSAEADMWAAAVEQAFRAGCAPRIPGNKPDMGGASALVAANEWRFLTAPRGPWAESRHRICTMCGIEPEVVRQEALRRGPSRHALFGLRAEMKVAELNERDRRMMDDYAAGRPFHAMVAEYGVSESRIKQIAGENGIKRARVQVRLPAPQIQARNAALLKEYAAGVDIKEMVARYSLTAESIQTIAARNRVRRPAGYNAAIGAAAAKAAVRNNPNAERDAEIFSRWQGGSSFAAIGRAMQMHPDTARSVVNRMKKRAASNASGGALGGACVAGGGGGGVCASFHAQGMEEASQ